MLSGSNNEGLALAVCLLEVLLFIGWSTITLESFKSRGNVNFKYQHKNYLWARVREKGNKKENNSENVR